MTGAPHIPVLLSEVLEGLDLARGGVVADCTFGAGGYSRAILENSDAHVVAIDRDPSVRVYAQPLKDAYGKRFTLLEGRFSQLVPLLKAAGLSSVSGIVFDIGVSSMHLDTPERGFSFMTDAPLDMRMSSVGENAADLLAQLEAGELAHILRLYGDERLAKRIAQTMVRAREDGPILTTLQLSSLVTKAVGAKQALKSTARVFQALRIAVNDELGELRQGLAAAEILLEAGGRLCVVTFHSGEDKIVKKFLSDHSGKTAQIRPSRHLPDIRDDGPLPPFKLLRSKAIVAGEAELAANSRARSAKLRVAERTNAPAWAQEGAA
ncbi:MAG: 16S rRNA (cytosine(1402)-N(4))-methyltransferase RsmH [Pseudomonadota bacterium]